LTYKVSVRTTFEITQFTINRLNRGLTLPEAIDSICEIFTDISYDLQKYKHESPLKINTVVTKGFFGFATIPGDFDQLVESNYFIALIELLRQIKQLNIYTIIDVLSSFVIELTIYFGLERMIQEEIFNKQTPELFASKFIL
jgi:hypothetical protein